MQVQRLTSSEDASVNFVFPTAQGPLEARYVRREGSPYFIAYLSSHAGCDRACRFCHLTALGETSMAPAMIDDYITQAQTVLHHWSTLDEPADHVNFNFMARGEPLANPVVLANYQELAGALQRVASFWKLPANLNISTIMPREIERIPLTSILRDWSKRTSVYYSLYSMNPEFRRQWLPKAMEPGLALDKLALWQQETGGEVVLHHAMIRHENDDAETAQDIIDAVLARGLKARFNLVRYNTPNPLRSGETDEHTLQARFRQLRDGLGDHRSRIVPRVGFDVKASCGMFVGQSEAACH